MRVTRCEVLAGSFSSSGKASSRAGSGSMQADRDGGSGEVCGPDGSCQGGSVPPSDAH